VTRGLYAAAGRPDAKGPRHALVYPAEQRGQRIRWRSATFALYFVLQGAALWIVHVWGWPEVIAIPVVSLPYWHVVTAVWSRYGPYMPGLD
jgi:hypothetical protein